MTDLFKGFFEIVTYVPLLPSFLPLSLSPFCESRSTRIRRKKNLTFLEILLPDPSPTMAKNLEICMTDILAQLVDAAQQVPEPVLELLLSNFNPQAIKANPAAHNLAVQVCLQADHRLQKYVAHYFTDVITSSLDDDQDKNERDANLTRTYTLIMEINRTVPALLLNVVPQMEGELTSEDQSLRLMVTRVLGQMFGERRTNTGTSTEGMTEGAFARTYPSVWKAWIKRANDRSYHVRIVWLESAQGILRYHPSLVSEVIPVVKQKLLDPDERVRTIAARVLGSMDYETALHRVPKSLLEALAERCLDKKRIVRENAMNALGRLFHLAFPEIESHDKAAIEQFAWIPASVLAVLKTAEVTDQDVADVVERWILPYPSYGSMGQSFQTKLRSSQSSSQSSSSQQSQSQSQSLTAGVAFTGATDESAWVGRLLLVLKYGDSFTRSAIFKLGNLLEPLTLCSRFLTACQEYNGGVMNEDEAHKKVELKALLKAVAKVLGEQPGADRIASDLLEFARLNDSRSYAVLRISMDPKQDMKSLLKARMELRRRLESNNASKNAQQTMMHFWRSTSFPLVNRTTVGQLLRGIQMGRPGSSAASASSQDSLLPLSPSRASLAGYEVFLENATAILTQVAKMHPAMLIPFVPELIRIVRDGQANDDDNPYATTLALRSLAGIARADRPATKLVRESKAISALTHFALMGNADEAKFATETLAIMSERNSLLKQGDGAARYHPPGGAKLSQAELVSAQHAVGTVLETIADELSVVLEGELASHLAALLAIVKYAPDVFEDRAQSIMKDVIHAIKRPWIEVKDESGTYHAADPNEWREDNEDDWVEPEDMEDNTRSRMLGLRLITKRAEVYAHTEHAEMTLKPILRFLLHTIGADVDLGTDQPKASAFPPMPGHARSWLRLTASNCLLKLARHKAYGKWVQGQMLPLAFMVQDWSFGVRNLFLRKLCTYLSRSWLPHAFYSIPFLVALDPEEENQHVVRFFLRKVIWGVSTAQRFKTIEYTFARFLHLLAHHPDFRREDPAEVLEFSRYLDFYLSNVANEENINLFWYFGSRLKTLRTTDSVGSSENLYALCELAQLRIKRKAIINGWTIEPWPGKIVMPSDIFRPLPSKEVQKEIYSRQFLPDLVVKQLNDDLESISTKKRPPAERAIEKSKRTKTTTTTNTKKRAASAEDDEEDEVEHSDDDDGASESNGSPQPPTKRPRPKPRAAKPKGGEQQEPEEEEEEGEQDESDQGEAPDVDMSDAEEHTEEHDTGEEEAEATPPAAPTKGRRRKA